MGNLIKDFWTLQYDNKSYYGIVEVVGHDLQFRRETNKFETRIEKALAYLEGKRMLSHISVQSYNSYLNKGGVNRVGRTVKDKAFYPFFLEFEPHIKPGHAMFWVEYQKAVSEAYRTANYMIYEKGLEPEDILIIITNSRSVYLFVNPVAYQLRPSDALHDIYKKMYEELDEVMDFKYVDKSLFRFNGLIKTPGAYYQGGYVVPISIEELKGLAGNPEGEQKRLTRKQRNLSKEVPGRFSGAFSDIYKRAMIEVYEGVKKVPKNNGKKTEKVNTVTYLKSGIGCIDFLESNKVAEGQRNFALVGLAIAYKNAGFSQEQALAAVKNAAKRWNYDEMNQVKTKVNTVYKKDYNFSCEYLKEHVDLCGSCACCKLNKGANKSLNTKFWVGREVISQLKANKASVRHYRAYLIMSRNELFGRYFDPEEYNLDPRVIRELVKMTGGERELQNRLVKASISHGDRKYLIPNEFLDNGEYEALGERIKAYLILYTKYIYKATDKYGMMRVKIETIAAELGYKSKSSVYKLLQDLVRAGMAVVKKGCLFSLYFSSYKVTSMDDHKESKGEKEEYLDGQLEYKTGTYDGGESRLYLKFSRGSP